MSSKTTQIKATLLGNSGVGKTQFVEAAASPVEEVLADNIPFPRACTTIAVDFRVLHVPVQQDRVLRVLMWDTAGQERYASFAPHYMRESEILFVLFDVTNRESFADLDRRWLPLITSHRESLGADNIIVYLIGNKCDLKRERIITTSDAVEYALKHKLFYAETTARIRRSVHVAIEDAVKQLHALHLKNGTLVDRHGEKEFTRYSGNTTVVVNNGGGDGGKCNC